MYGAARGNSCRGARGRRAGPRGGRLTGRHGGRRDQGRATRRRRQSLVPRLRQQLARCSGGHSVHRRLVRQALGLRRHPHRSRPGAGRPARGQRRHLPEQLPGAGVEADRYGLRAALGAQSAIDLRNRQRLRAARSGQRKPDERSICPGAQRNLGRHGHAGRSPADARCDHRRHRRRDGARARHSHGAGRPAPRWAGPDGADIVLWRAALDAVLRDQSRIGDRSSPATQRFVPPRRPIRQRHLRDRRRRRVLHRVPPRRVVARVLRVRWECPNWGTIRAGAPASGAIRFANRR